MNLRDQMTGFQRQMKNKSPKKVKPVRSYEITK